MENRFLSIFGEGTVIKKFCLPKINHIVAVVPNQGVKLIRELDSEFNAFINSNNPSVSDVISRHMAE